MNIKKLIPGMQHTPVTADDGCVCGVMVLYCTREKKAYIGYRSNLCAGVTSIMSALRNNRHSIKGLQDAYSNETLEVYTYPTDTIGEAVDLKNSIIDEHARADVFFNVYGVVHVARVTQQLARFKARRSSKVSVKGRIFDTRKDAAIAFGFTESTVSYRIKSDLYPDWMLEE